MSELLPPSALSFKQRRAINALVDGPVDREVLDRIAGTTNSPDVVRELRLKGVDIRCELVKARNRDGEACRYGRYSLTAMGLARVRYLGWAD